MRYTMKERQGESQNRNFWINEFFPAMQEDQSYSGDFTKKYIFF